MWMATLSSKASMSGINVENAKDRHFFTIKHAVTQQTFKKAYDALEQINLWSACLARLS